MHVQKINRNLKISDQADVFTRAHSSPARGLAPCAEHGIECEPRLSSFPMSPNVLIDPSTLLVHLHEPAHRLIVIVSHFFLGS